MKVSFSRSWTSTARKIFSELQENFLITMITLVFVILKHSLQWRGEFHLYFGPVPEFLLVNSAARRFLMASGFEGKFLSSFLYLLMRSLTIFVCVGIWADNLCPASQWKCWKSDIRSSVFIYIYTPVFKNVFIQKYIYRDAYFCLAERAQACTTNFLLLNVRKVSP